MLENQVQALGTIMKSSETRTLMSEGAFSLMKCVLFNDYGSGADSAKAAATLVFHTPTMLYWDKMWRYMCGVYMNPEDQIKLAEKFYDDNPKYEAFVKKQMHMINELNDDAKIDYYAQLTRSYLLTELQDGLYLKLAKFLSMCTPTELQFLEETPIEARLNNSMMAASLYQYGLLALEKQEDGTSRYVLSDFAISLKQNSLNFDEGVCGQKRLTSYEMMTPASLPEYATADDIGKLFENQEIIMDGGTASQWGSF